MEAMEVEIRQLKEEKKTPINPLKVYERKRKWEEDQRAFHERE